jgi:hypothetical protein
MPTNLRLWAEVKKLSRSNSEQMSSVLSAYADTVKLPTKFSSLITPSYQDDVIVTGETIDMPIPFTVVNQILDINVSQSTAIQTFVDNGTRPRHNPSIQGKAFGGTRLIVSLGTNLINYFRNWIGEEEEETYTGPVVLFIQPVMTKVQLANPSFADDVGAFETERSWGITTEAPVSGEFTGGGTANNFFTAWIFKTPMTVQYVAAGGFKYITMTSQFSDD